jgi:hypothetical protein
MTEGRSAAAVVQRLMMTPTPPSACQLSAHSEDLDTVLFDLTNLSTESDQAHRTLYQISGEAAFGRSEALRCPH